MSEMRHCSAMDSQGLTKVGNEVKPLKYSEKSCISYQLKQMFKCTATDLDMHPTTTRQRLTCTIKKCQVAA